MSAAFFFRDYWSYYIELENEFIDTIKYVELCSDNYKTYSVEYLKLLQAICSEIDTIGKRIAVSFNPNFTIDRNTNIKKWGYEVQKIFTDIQGRSVCLKRPRYELVPFKNWKYTIKTKKNNSKQICLDGNSKSLFWWSDYNFVKHARTSFDDSGTLNFSKANLKNVVYSLSALYLLERLYLEKQYNISSFPEGSPLSPPESKLFCLFGDIIDSNIT